MRAEYPRPQLKRDNWLNLNGSWQFAFDDKDAGLKEGWFKGGTFFPKNIEVPFVYQSELSGINEKGLHSILWYQREIELTEKMEEKEIILHFGAVYYEAMIFVNGHQVGKHIGGHTPFKFNITPYLKKGKQTITVRVFDPQRDETIPRGKQSWLEEPKSIWYTNSSGIWQTVWIEAISTKHFSRVRFTPNLDQGAVKLNLDIANYTENLKVYYEISFKEQLVARGNIELVEEYMEQTIDLYQKHIFRTSFHDSGWNWTPETPNLFDVNLMLLDFEDNVQDQVSSYFGLRKVHQENGMVYLNNRPYYQKLVLDQGYWPEGLLTAPSDESFKEDIRLAKDMGFNGCRKHQKVEDPRFLYWADVLGFIVWGESAASPMYNELSVSRTTNEWLEIIERDYNHPSIITWVPLNESWGIPNIHNDRQQQHFSESMYHLIHALDKTRLVISNDGWEMTVTDICAIHNYSHGNHKETKKYAHYVDSLSNTEKLVNQAPASWDVYAKGFSYQGEPILLTEFGGIGYKVGEQNGWGYTNVYNEAEFLNDYKRIMDAIYNSHSLHGYCYTQLTDVEQEINGLLTYDRQPKVDLSAIKAINDQYRPEHIKQQ